MGNCGHDGSIAWQMIHRILHKAQLLSGQAVSKLRKMLGLEQKVLMNLFVPW